jgi:hypothetical protein
VRALGAQQNSAGQRFLLTTSTGASQYWKLGGVKWTREESFAEVRGVRFIELGEPEVEDASGVMAEEGFFGRLTRHVIQLKVRWLVVYLTILTLRTGPAFVHDALYRTFQLVRLLQPDHYPTSFH